jgi:hypothetical protein
MSYKKRLSAGIGEEHRHPAAQVAHLSKAWWSLSNLASMLQLNLFTHRDLNAWL